MAPSRLTALPDPLCHAVFVFIFAAGDIFRQRRRAGKSGKDLTMTKTGEKLDADRKYVVGGWASVNENVEGPAIYDLMEGYISRKKSIDLPAQQAVKVIGL